MEATSQHARFSWDAAHVWEAVRALWERFDSHYLTVAASVIGGPREPRRRHDRNFLRLAPVAITIIGSIFAALLWIIAKTSDYTRQQTNAQRDLTDIKNTVGQDSDTLNQIKTEMKNVMDRQRQDENLQIQIEIELERVSPGWKPIEPDDSESPMKFNHRAIAPPPVLTFSRPQGSEFAVDPTVNER